MAGLPVGVEMQFITIKVKFVCIECLHKYDPDKSRANYRGYCSRKCEGIVEKRFSIKSGKYESEKQNRFLAYTSKTRQLTPGADPVPPRVVSK